MHAAHRDGGVALCEDVYAGFSHPFPFSQLQGEETRCPQGGGVHSLPPPFWGPCLPGLLCSVVTECVQGLGGEDWEGAGEEATPTLTLLDSTV